MSRTPQEIEVTELLRRVADYARTDPSDRSEPVVAEDRRRREPTWTAGMAAALVLVVALAGVTILRRQGSTGRVDTTGGLAQLAGSTRRLADAGLAGRTGAASVWTGTELLVWGGLTLDGRENRWLADGAALDPVSNRWRPLPPAPIGPRYGAAAVWTGTEMVVSGGNLNSEILTDGAAFDPRTNRWRTIAAQPYGGVTRTAGVWSGTEMLLVSSMNGLNATAYNPSTDRWRRLAEPPGAPLMPFPEAVWTGSELVMIFWPSGSIGTRLADSSPPITRAEERQPVVTTLPPGPPGTLPPPPSGLPATPPVGGPNSSMFVAAYSPASDRWTRLPGVVFKDGSLPRITWTGREVLVLQATLPGAAFDPGLRTWRPLSPVPVSDGWSAPVVWTGRYALSWSGGNEGLAYDPASDVWSAFDAGGLKRRSDPVLAWADGLLLAWSGYYNTDTGAGRLAGDGILYRPPS